MPLSDVAKQALDSSAEINRIQEQQRQEQQRQAEEERKKQEEEYNQYLKQQAEIEKQIKDLELRDQLIAQEQQKAQEQIELKQQQRTQELGTINNKIEQLEKEKQEALSQHHADYWGDGGRRSQGVGRAVFLDEQYKIERDYNSRINAVKRDLETKQQTFALEDADLPQWVKTKALREWDPVSFSRTSAVNLAQRYYDSFEAEAERKRRSSITTAKSNAIKEREKLQFTIKEFETKRDTTGEKLNEAQAKLKQLKTQTAIKKKPQVYNSSFFRDLPQSATPKTIQGKDALSSAKAYATFEQTQRQQKKLYEELTQAKTAQQALDIRSRYQQANPYTGTANVILNKGTKVEEFGFTIEKKLDKKFDTDVIPSEQANPKLKTFAPISTPQQTLIQKDESGIIQTTKPIPSYIFLDEQGNTKEITTQEMFAYASYLIDKAPKMPNKADKKINQYINENAQAIEKTQKQTNDKTGSTFRLTKDYPFEEAFLDHATELRAGVSNIFKPEDQQEQFTPTLEGQAINDLIEASKSTIEGKPIPKSEAYETFQELLKTPEGQAKIAGSITGSLAIAGSALIVPPLAIAKYSEKFIRPKTVKIAEEIATKLRIAGRDPELEKMLDKFPKMPEAMKQKIRNEKGSGEVVGVEMLDDRTALIKRGTELNEVTSPYIVVKTGKNPRGTIYETYTQDNPGTFKEILISGKQAKELEGGAKVTKDIVSYPGKPENLLKASQTDKLAIVGTSQKVGLEGLRENPAGVITKIESQQVKTGTVIQETEKLDPLKGFNRDASKLGKPDDFKISTKPNKPTITETPTIKNIDIETPKTKPQPTTKTKDPTKQRKQELEKIIKQTETAKPETFNVLSASASINLSLQGVKSQAVSLSKQGTKTATQAIQSQQEAIKTEIKTKDEIVLNQKDILKNELDDLQKTKPSIDPKYSLIVKGTQQTETGVIPRYTLETKQTPILDVPPKIPTETTPKKPTIPRGFDITLNLDEKKELATKKPKGKLKTGFWRWNVNTQEVGQYLPTRDLTTGRTYKAISNVDKLEKKVNRPGFWQKVRRKEEKYFKTGLGENRSPLVKKSNIVNISKPKGKKANKFLKKFKIDFGF